MARKTKSYEDLVDEQLEEFQARSEQLAADIAEFRDAVAEEEQDGDEEDEEDED